MEKSGTKKVGYVWKFSNDSDMVYWSKGSSGSYFGRTTKFVPSGQSERQNAGISAPAKLAFDALAKRGIIAGGFSVKARGYYHTIGRHKYANFVAVISGALRVRGNAETRSVPAGGMFVVPPHSGCIITCAHTPAKILWFHLAGDWRKICGNRDTVVFKECSRMPLLTALAKAYEAEAFSECPDFSILANCADSIANALARELCQKRDGEADKTVKLSRFLEDFARCPEVISLARAAHKAQVGTRELDSHCIKTHGVNFSKFAKSACMNHAAHLVAEGRLTCAQIAGKIGYSNPFSFSRAFFNFYGKRPSAI